MAYARQNYSDAEIKKMIEGTVNVSVASGGGGRAAPNPHASIHAPTDELHSHPLFQKARISSGDVPKHSVVVNTDKLVTNLRKAMNFADMQTYLAKLDPKPATPVDHTWHPGRIAAVERKNTELARTPTPQKSNIWVNINFPVGQGLVNEYADSGGTVATRQFTYQCLGVKLMVNPNNRDIPVLQTCVPMENTSTGDFHVTVTP